MENNELCFWHNEKRCQSCLLWVGEIISREKAKEPRNEEYYNTVLYTNHDTVKEWTRQLKTREELKDPKVFEQWKEWFENIFKEPK